MDSTTESTNTANTEETSKPKARLVDMPVTNANEALNMLVTFLNLAQKRGAFTIDESAKIWSCIQFFNPTTTTEK
jgi:hypothetical protein